MNRIHVRYYAVLREQAGRSEERIETDAATPRALYESLRRTHAFSLPVSLLRVAVNDEFADWDLALADGDRIVFIPPVAGG